MSETTSLIASIVFTYFIGASFGLLFVIGSDLLDAIRTPEAKTVAGVLAIGLWPIGLTVGFLYCLYRLPVWTVRAVCYAATGFGDLYREVRPRPKKVTPLPRATARRAG